MSEKRFVISEMPYDDFIIKDMVENKEVYNSGVVDLLNELAENNEQLRQELKEYKENWDDLVELATKTSLRNVELVEENAQLHRKIDWLCEVFNYGSDESMHQVKEYEKSKTKQVKSIKFGGDGV